MCQQVKMGFTLCPHVAYDLYLISCPLSVEEKPCAFKRTNIPDIIWLETREVGKCHFCMLEEQDKMDRKRRRRDALRRMDWD